MAILNVRFKKLNEAAVVPSYAKPGDAGLDLTACSEKVIFEHEVPIIEYGTGISVEIPEGFVGLIFQRSSVTTKTTLTLGNAVGVIDAGYRGEIKLQFRNALLSGNRKYKVGDRVGQLVILQCPVVKLEQVDQLSETSRGEGGFGSTN